MLADHSIIRTLQRSRTTLSRIALAMLAVLISLISGLGASAQTPTGTNPAPPLAGGMALYDDAYVWQNWSWTATDPANLSPVESGISSIAVTATAYGALRFHHDPVDMQS